MLHSVDLNAYKELVSIQPKIKKMSILFDSY